MFLLISSQMKLFEVKFLTHWGDGYEGLGTLRERGNKSSRFKGCQNV